MLNPQVIMNLSAELGISVDLTGRSRRVGKRFIIDPKWFFPLGSPVSAFRSETNEFHNGLSIVACSRIRVERETIFMGYFRQWLHSECLKAPSEPGDRAKRCLSEG